MKKLIFIFSFLLLFACNKSDPVFNQLSPQAVILAFGDSLTYGTGTSEDTSYPSVLSKLSSHQIINAGKPGEISSAGLNRLPPLLDKHRPELLILIHGGNDILRKVPQSQTQSNLTKMVSAAKQRGIKVVMLGVPKPSLFLMSSADIYQQVAEETKTPIDLETLPDILSSSHLKSDTIHPNSEGYKLMAENIFKLLVSSGAL